MTYYVHPSRSVIVKAGQSTSLRVLYKDKDLDTDVTAVQVSIWNQGKDLIRKEQILSNAKIVTRPLVPVLEATVSKPSRNVIDFNIDESHLSEGYVPLSWRILEQDDGAVVQLVYAGSSDIEIQVEATIEGQAVAPTRFAPGRNWFILLLLVNIIGYAVMSVRLIKSHMPIIVRIVLLLLTLPICLMSVYYFIRSLMGALTASGSPYGI
ncbi:MAG: hypothetical protein AABO57_11265 [Acidobacteriota bacterium]